MKIVPVGVLAVFALPVNAGAEVPDGWYTMNTLTQHCIRSEEGPAGLIGSMRTFGGQYRVAEATDPVTGQIARVAIALPDFGIETVFFRGARRCQDQLDALVGARNAEQRRIEDRYRIEPAPAPAAPSASASPTARQQPAQRSAPEQERSMSVLDTLQRLRTQQPDSGPAARPVPDGAPALTQGEIRGLADQLSECWNVDRGMLGVEQVVVELRITLDANGVVRAVTPVGGAPSDPRRRTIYEAARRTLMSPQCNPLRVPPSKYPALMSSVFRFNARGLVR